MAEKRCRGCDRTLPLDEFWNDKTGRGGKNPRCRDCCKAKAKASYDPVDYLNRLEAEVERQREALWAIVNETSNDPQRIKDVARGVLGDG